MPILNTLTSLSVRSFTQTSNMSLKVINNIEFDKNVNKSVTPASVVNGKSPFIFSISPTLPSGLTLDSATGVISGSPLVSFPLTTFTITVKDSFGVTINANFTLQVYNRPLATVTSPVLLFATGWPIVTPPGVKPIDVINGVPPYTYTLTNPSTSINMNSNGFVSFSNTVISGRDYIVTITDSAQNSVTANFNGSVRTPPTLFNSKTLVQFLGPTPGNLYANIRVRTKSIGTTVTAYVDAINQPGMSYPAQTISRTTTNSLASVPRGISGDPPPPPVFGGYPYWGEAFIPVYLPFSTTYTIRVSGTNLYDVVN